MATFKEQIEGMTGISLGTTPTDSQITQFLKDGIIDVQNRHIALKPADAYLFAAESEESINNAFDLKGSKIVSVVREAGVDNDWRECRFISPGLQSRVTDTDSLQYASKYNPVYTIFGDNEISVFPSPSATTDAFKVYYINNDPLIVSETDNTINNFPANKVYLVVLYASIQSIAHKMTYSATDLPTYSGQSASGSPNDAGWGYVDYLLRTAEDIELANAKQGTLSSETQQLQVEYQWYAEKLKILKEQYDIAFSIEKPPAPANQGGR